MSSLKNLGGATKLTTREQLAERKKNLEYWEKQRDSRFWRGGPFDDWDWVNGNIYGIRDEIQRLERTLQEEHKRTAILVIISLLLIAIISAILLSP